MTFGRAPEAIVVDASVAVPVLQGDADLLTRWEAWQSGDDLVLVPPTFPFEVANALLRGTSIRSSERVMAYLERLAASGYEVADRGPAGLLRAVRLAAAHRVTVYDAAYLDLAIDVDGSLATLDRDLRKAAEAEGVTLIP